MITCRARARSINPKTQVMKYKIIRTGCLKDEEGGMAVGVGQGLGGPGTARSLCAPCGVGRGRLDWKIVCGSSSLLPR